MKTEVVRQYTLEPDERLAIIVQDRKPTVLIANGELSSQDVCNILSSLRAYCRSSSISIDVIYDSVVTRQESDNTRST